MPDQLIDDTEAFWQYIRDTTEDFCRRAGSPTAIDVRAGGRSLRVVARPGHSTTDTLFVDDRDAVAFVGDHLLAPISSNTEICPPGVADGRARSRVRYLQAAPSTQAMPLARLLTGHGAPVIARPAGRGAPRDHRRRCERILAASPAARHRVRDRRPLWPERTVTEQPLLVVWEVVGNLELLLTPRRAERAGDAGSVFELTPRPRRRPPPPCCAAATRPAVLNRAGRR